MFFKTVSLDFLSAFLYEGRANPTKIPIKEIRGKGLLIAIEFTEDARKIVEEFKDNGILAKDTHSTIIRFAPPLIITKDEIDWAIENIEKVLVS